MSYNVTFTASNKADFIQFFSAVDVDTNEDMDLTGADIVIDISDGGCVLISATSDNGLITFPSSTVISLNVPAARMSQLCPGTLKLGGVFELNGETSQLAIGSLVIYDGIASV